MEAIILALSLLTANLAGDYFDVVQDQNQLIMEAFNDGDISDVVELYHKRAVLQPGNSLPSYIRPLDGLTFFGAKGIRAFALMARAAGAEMLELNTVFVIPIREDLIIEYGNNSISYNGDIVNRDYLVLWKMVDDDWLVWRDYVLPERGL